MKYFIFFFTLILFPVFCNAQVAITDIDTVSTVDSSAILDLSSENRGFLPPRMNTTKIDSIFSPAEGLVVYNTTLGTLMYFDGADWSMMKNMDGESCGTVSYESQTYETVIIGKQCWLAGNLNVGLAILGDQDQSENSIIEKYCYDDKPDSCAVYGGLYQWAEMVQYLNGASNTTSWDPAPSGHVQGICPPGWHIPKDLEMDVLEEYLGGSTVAGGKMKETGTEHWQSPNTGATNESGFTGLPGGVGGGIYMYINTSGTWWISTESDDTHSWRFRLHYTSEGISRTTWSKDAAYSVRCIKN